ncbi:MAG TPA: histidine kinase [Acidimicrobiales bacterium]|nr:histidine kinase [Acidimicrobiales bacterium]
MSTLAQRHQWVSWARSRVAAPHAPVLAGSGLVLIATVEALAHAVVSGAGFNLVVVLLAVSTTIPLTMLRPAEAAVAVSGAAVVSLSLFHTWTAAGLAAELMALYSFGQHSAIPGPPSWARGTPRRQQLAALGLSAPFLVLALLGSRPLATEAGALTVLAAALAPAAVWAGMAHQSHREAVRHDEARRRIAGTLLEDTARSERTRIARELHDVVAHHISMVAVQAEAARLTTPGMPAAGAERLSAIGDTAREALTEMRRLLGVLREDSAGYVPERQPQPGVTQLIELLDAIRTASGTGARLILSGSEVVLDPVVEVAAYRIAQEALTNARRHAPGAAVDVELRYHPQGLLLRIRDNGPGPPAPESSPDALDDAALGLGLGGGHGVAGMQERAAAVGGRVRTGPAVGGGFLVEAQLPAKAEALG